MDDVVATVERTEATPADVASLMDLGHKLLRTSAVHYEFAALAAEMSLKALEQALRVRLGADGRPTFKTLVDRVGNDAALGPEAKDLLDAGRELRNFFAHPATAPAMPIVMATGLLRTSFRLIAQLFPDEAGHSEPWPGHDPSPPAHPRPSSNRESPARATLWR